MGHTRKNMRHVQGGVVRRRQNNASEDSIAFKLSEKIRLMYITEMNPLLDSIRNIARPEHKNNPERIDIITKYALACKDVFHNMQTTLAELQELSDKHQENDEIGRKTYFHIETIVYGLYKYILALSITANVTKKREWLEQTADNIEIMKSMKGNIDKFCKTRSPQVCTRIEDFKDLTDDLLKKVNGLTFHTEKTLEKNAILEILQYIITNINVGADALEHIRQIAGHRIRTTRNGRLVNEEGRELDKEMLDTLEEVEHPLRQAFVRCKIAEKIALKHPHIHILTNLAIQCYYDLSTLADEAILSRVIVANKVYKDLEEKRKFLREAEIYTNTLEKGVIAIINKLAENENNIFVGKVTAEQAKRKINAVVTRSKAAIRIAKKTDSLMREREAIAAEEAMMKEAKKVEREQRSLAKQEQKRLQSYVAEEQRSLASIANAMVSPARVIQQSVRRQSVRRPNHNQPIGGSRA